MTVVLKPERGLLSTGLGSGCDPEGDQPRKEPRHPNPDASLTELAVKTHTVLLHAERHGGEMDSIVVLQRQ
jgi:hypothetical protein